jgi:uncharacterized protein (TIGR00251 family)
MTPPCLRESEEGVLLALKVTPRASADSLVGLHGHELRVKVTAPPVDSAANAAVLQLLSEKLGCSRSSLRLIRGATNPHKSVLVSGMTVSEVARRLGLAT